MKSAKTALALLLLAAFVAFTDATTYQQCDPVTNSDCTYKYLPSCSGRGAPPSGTVYFTKEVDCCQCNDLAGSCYGCTSSLDCSYGSSTCGNLALTISTHWFNFQLFSSTAFVMFSKLPISANNLRSSSLSHRCYCGTRR